VDEDSNLLTLQRDEREREVVRGVTLVQKYLRRIDTKIWPPERLQWLWEQVLKEDYATDDIGAATPELFISNLYMANSLHYEFGDDAYIALLNVVARINADIHFAVWGDVSIPTIIDCHNYIADDLFERLELNRLTAYIPSFNKKMVRFATVLGYRYEGEVREIFLKNGVYHNLYVYGLLRKEYVRRKGGVSSHQQPR
jgi:hypothetical protein